MSNKAKIIIIVVILSVFGGIVLYSTIHAHIESEKLRKKAEEDFAKVWYSEENIAEREHALDEIIEIGEKYK